MVRRDLFNFHRIDNQRVEKIKGGGNREPRMGNRLATGRTEKSIPLSPSTYVDRR